MRTAAFIFAFVSAIAAGLTIWAFFFPTAPTASADQAYTMIAESDDPCDFALFIAHYPTDPIFARRARERLEALGECSQLEARPSLAEIAAGIRRAARRGAAKLARALRSQPGDAQASAYDMSGLRREVREAVATAVRTSRRCDDIRQTGEVFPWHDGAYYGENADGTWLGCGYYAFRNGDTHIGRWGESGTYTHGTYLYADGRRYEGQFLNLNRPGYDMEISGRGVLWSRGGELLAAGYWREGQLLRAE